MIKSSVVTGDELRRDGVIRYALAFPSKRFCSQKYKVRDIHPVEAALVRLGLRPDPSVFSHSLYGMHPLFVWTFPSRSILGPIWKVLSS